MRQFILCIFILFSFFYQGNSQRNCATAEVMEQEFRSNPEYQKNVEAAERHTEEFIRKHPNGSGSRVVTTIPVVFHVVYNSAAENVSDAQLLSQLTVLNQDFRYLNPDKINIPAAFLSLAADSEFEFCLAQQSPTGQATTGINRRQTTVTSFTATSNAVKYTAQGGLDAWDRTKYLNIWVCNLATGTNGYAQLPGGTAATDGVVLDFQCVGTTGTAVAPFDKGRTGTHEVAHWLNLRHIWGDATCGTDNVADTPLANTANTGCPAYGHRSTCKGTPIEMVNNYMDFTDDGCMNMFTIGQKTRMKALFASGGLRASLATSPGCLPPVSTCPLPSGLASANVTTNSASISWTAAAGASSYNLQYRALNATNWTAINAIAGTSQALGSLNSSTTYEVQVQTNCGTAVSSFTPSHNFTTSAAQVCLAPTGLAVANLTSSTAELSWTGYLGAVDYSIELQPSGSTVWSTAGTAVQGVTSFTLSGLSPSALYYVRVSSNCTGQSVYSANLAFTTAASFCAAPTGLTSSNATTTTISCTWNPVIGVSNYTFEYAPANSTIWVSQTVTSNTVSLSGLAEGITYNMRVLSACTDGTFSTYSTGQFSTLAPVVCDPPSSITISNITSTDATASWPAVANAGSYVFEFRPINTTVAWSASTNLTTTTYNFGGLSASTQYDTRVRTNCTGLSSVYSPVTTFSTGGTTVSCSDSYESNSKAASLTIPANGTSFTAKLTSATDQDWYKFVNTSTARNVRVLMSALPANYNMELYRSNSLVGSGVNAGVLDEKIIYNNTLSATTYYVKIVGVSGAFNTTLCYNFTAQISGTAFANVQDDGSELEWRNDLEAQPVKDEFLVFPNPAQDEVTLLLPMTEGVTSGQVTMIDLAGNVHLSESITSDEGLATMQMDVQDTPAGIYFLTFTTANSRYTQKLIISRQ
ncbi:MAG: fibronectin type III domain-containing protein [Saprospiraceae bacterium]|nr:fibronectin type III domain-containing protein [Saprospiraceae bacterium]